MKKVIISILAIILLPSIVYAADPIVISKSEMTLTEGETGEFTISVTNGAGRFGIRSNDTSVVTATPTKVWEDEESAKVTVTAIKKGEALIVVTSDDVSIKKADNSVEELPVKEYTIKINVVEKGEENPAENENQGGNPATNENESGERENPNTGAFLNTSLILISALSVAGIFIYINKKRSMI